MLKKVLLAVALVLATCDNADITGPTPPPTTTTPPDVPVEPPPPPIVAEPFSWEAYQGFTAFALGYPGQTEEDVKGLFRAAMARGWNTARVCSETEFWDGSQPYLVRKPRNLERLEWLLDTIARIPRAQVLLIGDCTLKGPVPEEAKRDWARRVARVAAKFPNVAVETHNEFDNCRNRGWGPHCPGKQDVAAHVRIYRDAGVRFVTADDSVCDGPDEPKTYQFRLSNIGASPADFHPCRGYPGRDIWDPSIGFLRELEAHNGLFVLSETVAWGDVTGRCSGLRTCDRDRIQTYINRCSRVPGCRFTFHSEALLAGWEPSWWPEAR